MNRNLLGNLYQINGRFALIVVLLFCTFLSVDVVAQHPFTLTTPDDVTSHTETLYWMESVGADGFYAIPHTDNSNVSTTNMPNLKALWYFMDAGIESNTQYYYIVNHNTGNYLKLSGSLGSNGSITIASFGSGGDAFKFFIGGSEGQWIFYPKNGNGNYWVNKQSGNVPYDKYFKSSNYGGSPDANSKWNFVVRNSVTWAHPFTNSTNSEKHYYYIHNAPSNGSAYYMSTDDDSDPYATISNVDDDKRIWYFVEAASDNNIPNLKYYYIVNAITGKYLKFTGTANGNVQANSLRLYVHNGTETGNTEDRFQFMVLNAKGDAYSAYSIMPKLEINYYDNKKASLSPGNGDYNDYSGSNAITLGNDMKIGIYNDRGQNNNYAHWKIEIANVEVEAPVITYDNVNHEINITCGTDGASIYYTLDGSTPTSGSTQYNGPVSCTSPCLINAVAVKFVFSSEVTPYNLQKVATPTFSLNTSNNVLTITSTTGASIYYSTGAGSTPGTAYGAPFEIPYAQSNQLYRAQASKEGWITSEIGEETIKLSCHMPSISFNSNTQQVTLTCADDEATMYYTTNGDTPTTLSTPYNGTGGTGAFTISSACTVRAIAVHTPNYNNSDPAELPITQVAQPIIQDNGSNAVSITCATEGATIYYTTDGSTPTTSSTEYEGPLTENVSGVLIKAIAVKENMINSPEGTGTVTLQCEGIVIRRSGESIIITCAFPSTGATIYYETASGSGTPATPNTSTSSYATSGELIPWPSDDFPVTVTAIATAANYDNSDPVTTYLPAEIHGSGTSDDPYLIASQEEIPLFVDKANDPDEAGAYYKVTSTDPLNFGSADPITVPFSGHFDGGFCPLTNLSHALFNTVNGGSVHNVILKDVNINGSGNVGAICNEADGTTRIYNCGILSGSVGGTNYVGGLVGFLDGQAHVVNCFSYAKITSGTTVAGIVGYNNVVSTQANFNTTTHVLESTMVMNCMFYGDITGGSTVSPVYGGENINNLQGGLNTFNYYAYDKLKTKAINTGKYNCALAVEDKYLNRFEFYRLLLNSNKKLAAIYVTGDPNDADLIAKWVLETADRTNTNPYPYPILKAQGRYPSIINPDIEHAPDSTAVGPNKGGKLGKTLAVTISESNTTSGGQTKPTGASVTTTSLTLTRTDKDFDRFNFNYDKVQLPYYNDVGSGNYTGNRVVTGWKITAITAVANDPYTIADYDYTKTYAANSEYFDYPHYNFADRKSSNKDLYTVSGRVFSQGAYFDVPYGVTSITIEPYWAKACYISDKNYDVVYKSDYSGKQDVSQTGTQATAGTTLFNEQVVQTSIVPALNYIANNLGGEGSTVYDNALVLVGNYHLDGVPLNGTRPFTMMSVDTDNDHEPDYSLIYHHKSRQNITPIRFDFLAVPGTAQAQKPNGASLICNFTIFKTRGWFEVTNTAFMYSNQLEYENGDLGTGVTKADAPLILFGGIFDQFVSTQSSAVNGHTIYIHLGGNLWIDQFGLGTHSDGDQSTPHVPVSVTGGDYVGFYLTGTYNQNADVKNDNAECYISGGRFGEIAGACQEQIGDGNNNNNTKGNVHWQIYNADITEFFGGGINDAKPVKGNITTEISNSRVHIFCGGPKFGDMPSGKNVTTTAEGCTFDKYFGAGFGGNSYNRRKYYDKDGTQNWNTLQNYYINERGKYYNGRDTNTDNDHPRYGKKGPGVATDFDYEFFVWSSGKSGARFFVKFISFSLAQCNNVESTLKRCTINGNFYGGGSLGKVSGTATSVLEDCIVNGDAYGAGFSATLPTIWVRNAGFKLKPNTTNQYYFPKFNNESGMFEPGVFSDSTEFTWKQVTSYPGEGGAGFDGTQVITTTSLEKTDLGSVGAVSLTIKGESTISGDVFGGGQESVVAGNTTVTLQGKTIVTGNVFGGGDQGVVGGNATVTIEPEPEPDPEPEPESPNQD